jgi:hypothetical protein
MRRPDLFTPLWLVVLAGCQFQASCGSGKTLRMDKAKEFVSSFLERETGQKPREIMCPESVKIAKGSSFACTASFAGPAVATLTIQQDDTEGNVTITSVTGILIIKKLEDQVAKSLGEKLNVHIKVDCEGDVYPSTPGYKFTCDAVDAQGASAKINVAIKDGAGNVTWDVAATQAPAPTPEAAPTP